MTGRRGDITLLIGGAILGAVVAAAYGAWRAVSETATSTGDRWSAFGEAMLFPGSLVILLVTVIVWLGWKVNIDG